MGLADDPESGGVCAHHAAHRAPCGDTAGTPRSACRCRCRCGAQGRPDRHARAARLAARCVLGCVAGVAVLMGALALGARRGGGSAAGAERGRRDGADATVRCVLSLKATGGVPVDPAGLAAGLTRSVAAAVSADEQDVAIKASRPSGPLALDLSLEMRASADASADAVALARRLRKKVDGGKLDDLLGAEGLAFSAVFRARPHPFSAAGLPMPFDAADEADAALVVGMLVPMMVLVPGLVFVIFHYQLVERLVGAHRRLSRSFPRRLTPAVPGACRAAPDAHVRCCLCDRRLASPLCAAQGIWYENQYGDPVDEAVFGDFGFHNPAPEDGGKAGDPTGMPARAVSAVFWPVDSALARVRVCAHGRCACACAFACADRWQARCEVAGLVSTPARLPCTPLPHRLLR